MDKCREQFEQWANDGFTGTLGRDLEGDYRNHFIQCQWEGWQAAWQAATEQASPPQWIPVSEQLPDTNTAILVFHEGEVKTAWFDSYQCAVGDNYAVESENSPAYRGFTHWMLQPNDPPKSA